jgi:UDPglucose 6-dehydrogenase
VAKGIGLDSRIGTRFLHAGVGWGGSCFGKDTSALISTAQEYSLTMPIVSAAREVNYRQRERVVEKLQAELKILKGRVIGLLGLAFKANTDDLREAPALEIARKLIDRGATVRAHDPVALDRARREYASLDIGWCETAEQLAQDADALVLVTEWPEYRDLDWDKLACQMKTPLVLDGRLFLDRVRLSKSGVRCIGVFA